MTFSAADAVADACRYFDRWLAFRQHYERVPGVQAAVLHGDQVMLSTAHGMADVESGVAMTPSHLFRIASHSKTFTATAIMQLAERDVVRLDDRVGAWLAFLQGSPLERATLREMLSHAAGVVRDGWDGDFWQLGHAFPDLERLQQISLDAADVLPRNERFKYSNVAYSLLGMVIAEATGQSYEQYVDQHIVRQLQLTDTGPELDPARADQYATGYSALSYADRRLPIEHIDTGAMASATGFYSTASDVVRYASAHFLDDDRLLTDDSKRQMQHTEWEVEGTAGTEYGLGFAISTIGKRRVLGHGGGYPGHITRTYFDPVEKLAVSVLTNSIDGPALTLATAALRLIDLALGDEVATDEATSPIDLSSFEGSFANLWGSFDIVALGGRLFQIDPTQPDPTFASTRLEVVDQNTLRIAKTMGYGSHGEPIAYDRTEDGTIISIRGGSGSTSYLRDALTAAVGTRDRITLCQPLAPG